MSKKVSFIAGSIAPEKISQSIAHHQSKHEIGAHNIFLGQVRADRIDGKEVVGIEFSNYNAMAEAKIAEIREETFDRYELSCMHIYHSDGFVGVGEICFFVFVSAPHRTEVYEATEYIVQRIKTEVPIFGKEIFQDQSFQWKRNK